MENRYYLAIDIGASSGRHILAHKKDGRIVLEEIYRFPNGMQEHTDIKCGMWISFLGKFKPE